MHIWTLFRYNHMLRSDNFKLARQIWQNTNPSGSFLVTTGVLGVLATVPYRHVVFSIYDVFETEGFAFNLPRRPWPMPENNEQLVMVHCSPYKLW